MKRKAFRLKLTWTIAETPLFVNRLTHPSEYGTIQAFVQPRGRVAELVDALVSGTSDRKVMRVRVPLRPPT